MRTDRPWPLQGVVDAFVSAEIGQGWQASFRPVVWRVGGTWETLVDQASVKREFRWGGNWRIEAGRFPSPFGFGMTENRANLNAGTLWCFRPYYMPLPSLGTDAPKVSLPSAVYPLGVSVGTSSRRWDARTAVVDRSPLEFWQRDPRAARGPNTIVGGGFTPRQGVRVGAATAWGDFAKAVGRQATSAYRTTGMEAEFAVGYTKVSGEWTRAEFQLPEGDRVALGWTAQIQHTLSPRVFAHSRATIFEAPERVGSARFIDRRYRSIDSTLGVRVNPEITLRLAHAAIDHWASPVVDHQVGLSAIWVRRWW